MLVLHFNGWPLDPGSDAVLDEGEEGTDRHHRLVRWNHRQKFQEEFVAELLGLLGLVGPDY